jgi:hypothetical protein
VVKDSSALTVKGANSTGEWYYVRQDIEFRAAITTRRVTKVLCYDYTDAGILRRGFA